MSAHPSTDTNPAGSSALRAAETVKRLHEEKLARWKNAWGDNLALVVNDDEIHMPDLPEDHEWMVTRELTGDHPTYRVALMYVDYSHGGERVWVLRHGHIDKVLYGEAGVRELAQRWASELT